MKKNVELALLEPNTEILQCSVCNEMVWKHSTEPIRARMSLPSRPWPENGDAFQHMIEAANEMHLQTVLLPAEEACRDHMQKKHRLRLWIWERYGWDRVLRRWFL